MRFKQTKIVSFFICFVIFLILNCSADADTVTWTGNGSDNLASNPYNWSGNTVPHYGDDVIFNATSKNCTWDFSETISSLTMITEYTSQITIISDVTLTIAENYYPVKSYGSGSGSYSKQSIEYDGFLYTGYGGHMLICCWLDAGTLWKNVDFSNFGDSVFNSGAAFGVFNNTLYYGITNYSPNDMKILVCNNKAAGGNAAYCDSTKDFVWTNNPQINIGGTGTYRDVWDMEVFNGYMYIGTRGGDGTKGADIYYCDPERGGSSIICDVPADWMLSFNTAVTAFDGVLIQKMEIYNGRLYATYFFDTPTSRVYLLYCDPERYGSANTCEQGDWLVALDSSMAGGLDIEGFTSIKAYNNCLYVGTSANGGNNQGELWECCNSVCNSSSDWDIIADTPAMEISDMEIWNQRLILSTGTTGPAGDDGDLYILNTDNTVTKFIDTWDGVQINRVMPIFSFEGSLFANMLDDTGTTMIYRIDP